MKFLFLLSFLWSINASAQSIIDAINFGKQVNHSDVSSYMHKNGCIMQVAPFAIELSTNYYPNTNNYQLQNPLQADCKMSDGWHLSIVYYFTSDSILRATLIDLTPTLAVSINPSEEEVIANKLRYQDKLTELQNSLISQLGQPYIAGEHKPIADYAERIFYKWQKEFNASLQVVYASKTGYSNLRLSLYKD